MNWSATLQNIAALGAMLACIVSGYPWWSLLFVLFVLMPKNPE